MTCKIKKVTWLTQSPLHIMNARYKLEVLLFFFHDNYRDSEKEIKSRGLLGANPTPAFNTPFFLPTETKKL